MKKFPDSRCDTELCLRMMMTEKGETTGKLEVENPIKRLSMRFTSNVCSRHFLKLQIQHGYGSAGTVR